MSPALRGPFVLERSIGKNLLQKHSSASRRKQEDTDYPKNGSIEVCIVIDVVLALLPLDIGIDQKKTTQQETREAE